MIMFVDVVKAADIEPSAILSVNRISGLMKYLAANLLGVG
jgi:hypothetical protein